MLQAENLTKNFGGLRVLNGASLRVEKGGLVGLIGPNGAGKTTLFNAISGAIRPDKGKIFFEGIDITGWKPHDIARLGIRRTFQLVKPFPSMTVLENVIVSYVFGSSTKTERGDARTKCKEYLEEVGLSGAENVKTEKLPIGQLRSLEVARALAGSPKLLLLDEVLAGLNESEISEKLELLRKLNSQGLTILMIEHNLNAIMSVCRRVVVLVEGSVIADNTPEKVVSDENVIAAYIGRGVVSI